MTVRQFNDNERRNVLVGIRFDCHTKELLNWSLVKVADRGDRVVAVHVCQNSDSISEGKILLDGYLDDYVGLCTRKEVELTGQVLKGSSIRKILVREAKIRAAVAVIVGINKHNAFGSWASIAKYCAKKLPPTTEVMAIHNGKVVVFRRCSNTQLPGCNGDPKPSPYLIQNPTCKDNLSEFDDSEISKMGRHDQEVIQGFKFGLRDGSGESKHNEFSYAERHKKGYPSTISLFTGEFGQQRPGWPLLRTTNTLTPPAMEARKMSVVQWVMNLPSRSPPETPQSKTSSSLKTIENTLEKDNDPEKLDIFFETNSSSGCTWFSYDILRNWTSHFSSENLIGKGGCNHVYKGLLPDGRSVAVKIMKSSKEGWMDFTREVNIITSLKHKSITPLLGICIEDNYLISVYDFLARGNLEESLHCHNKEKSALTWEVRFNIAVKIAEALDYLHNECSRPIIHRDVKSSNILLSDDYGPQLSDFGLATWRPTNSLFETHIDVVGTFGYLAPEYFMYGKVGDKIDVYSFGVVLLELLSGRKPISSDNPKDQGSLVMWAKPKLESGDIISILDPNLDKNVDEVQMQRMALAATLCLTRAARVRPNISQIRKILTGDKDLYKAMKDRFGNQNDSENRDSNDDDDDEVYPDSSA